MSTRPLKITHLLSCEGPWGDAIAALNLAREQSQAGDSPTLLIKSSSLANRLCELALKDGIPASELPGVPLTGGSARRTMAPMFRRLRASRPDVIHLHERGLSSRLVDVIAARMCRPASVIATAHFYGDFLGNSALEISRQQRAWRRASRFLDRVVCPSAHSANVQRRAGISERKLAVIHNPVDFRGIEAASGSAVREELGFLPEHQLILFAGRLDDVKRPLLTIDAFAMIAREFPKARLAICGEGPLRESCEARVSELGIRPLVRLLGYRTDVPRLMRAADIFHSPTAAEAFGITLIEAAAAGAAIVTSALPPMQGEVVPEGAGLFHELDDANGAADAFRTLLRDPARRAAIASNAAAHAGQAFAPAALAARYRRVYLGLDHAS